jgi:hypothetical protein
MRNMISLKEGVEIGRWGGASKVKDIFVKNNMTRDDAMGEEVKAAVTLVVRRVTEKKAASGVAHRLRGEAIEEMGSSV